MADRLGGKRVTLAEIRKLCEYFRKLSGPELQSAISLIFKDLPEGKSPRKYAMPSVQRGKIYTINFQNLSPDSLSVLIKFFNIRASQLGLGQPFRNDSTYLPQKATPPGDDSKSQQPGAQKASIPLPPVSPPSQRELENELSGLSALTGIQAVDITKASPERLGHNDAPPVLGKRARKEENNDVGAASAVDKPSKQKEDPAVGVPTETKKVENSISENSSSKEEPQQKKQKKAIDQKSSNEKDSDKTTPPAPATATSTAPTTIETKAASAAPEPAQASSEVSIKATDTVPAQEPAKSPAKAPIKPPELPEKEDVPQVEKETVAEKSKAPSVAKEVQDNKAIDVVASVSKPKVKKGKNSKSSAPRYAKEELTLGDKKWAEVCLSQIRAHPAADIFLFPVPKTVPKYYDIIKNPMDLKTMSEKLKSNTYKTKNQFLQDLDLIVKNCKTYNKPGSPIYKICLEFAEYIKEFTNPSEVGKDTGNSSNERGNGEKKATTPGGKKRKRLLGGDYAWCLMAIETLKMHALALPFYEPVSRSIPNYHKIIKRPMDFTTMTRKFERGNYDSKEACVKEIRQIFANCKLFNSEGTQLYKDAVAMERVLEQLLGNTSSRRGVATYSMPQDEYIQCTNLLYYLRIHDLAGPFTAPVDPGLKEYFKVVKKPVDLLSMGRKLHDGKYSSKKDFLKDVDQVFINCKLFNTPGSELYEDGIKLEQYYLDYMKKTEGNSGSSSK